MVLPRGIASVVVLKAFEVEVVDVPNALGELRLVLVDHTGVYVTVADPMLEPSVYVVIAFHKSVSACASREKTRLPSRIASDRKMAFAFISTSDSYSN
jgi:hypothetical protein